MGDSPIREIVISNEAMKSLKTFLLRSAYTGVLLIADNITYSIAGAAVKSSLASLNIKVEEVVLNRPEMLVPDEKALGEILLKIHQDIQIILAVGSGSINDLTRYIASKFGKPFISIPTAPSMDGYASPVAPLTIRGFKQTLPAIPPLAIFGELEVLASAPLVMKQAGYGDLFGKYTSLADWKLGQLINGESFSEEISSMIKTAVDQAIQSLSQDILPQVQAKHLTEALIVSGEAMLKWGDSRPASGAEHHMAHFWEMQADLTGGAHHLHGIKVGVATIQVLEIYHRLFKMNLSEVNQHIKLNDPESREDYFLRIKKAYGSLAGDILRDLNEYYLDNHARSLRQNRILENWNAIQKWVVENIPTTEMVREKLNRLGAPVAVEQIGLDRKFLITTLQNAKEVRKRYTIFRLIEDIGLKIENI